jgi:hypothetical protein
VKLAEQLRVPVITSDRRLANSTIQMQHRAGKDRRARRAARPCARPSRPAPHAGSGRPTLLVPTTVERWVASY